jgi:preprotein translocase subunit Sss1
MKLKEIAYVVKNSLLLGIIGFVITWAICQMLGLGKDIVIRNAFLVAGYLLVFVGFYGSMIRLLRKPL